MRPHVETLTKNAERWRRAKLKLVKKNNHVLGVFGAHLHMDHALPYTTLIWVAMASVINFVLVSINSPYHGGSSVVRSLYASLSRQLHWLAIAVSARPGTLICLSHNPANDVLSRYLVRHPNIPHEPRA